MYKLAIFAAVLMPLAMAEENHGSTAAAGSTQDNSAAGHTLPIKSGTDPSEALPCEPLKEYYNQTDGAGGLKLLRCNGAGDAFESVGTSVDTGDHAALANLDFASSGHTGFAAATHASQHQNGGSDEVATATPGANAIPKAGSGGTLALGWMPEMGPDEGSGGSSGLVPAPSTGDATKCLHGDATWAECGSLGVLDTKGQLPGFDGSATVAIDPGTTGQILCYDSTTESGLRPCTPRKYADEKAVAATQAGNSCYPGSGWAYLSATGPTCSTGAASSPYAWAGLDFPDGAAKCAYYHTAVSGRWDGSAVNLLLEWSKVPTLADGNVVWTVATAFITAGSNYSSPSFSTVSSAISDSSGDNVLRTATLALSMSAAAAGRSMIVQVCREAANGSDSMTAAARLIKIRIPWPEAVTLQ